MTINRIADGALFTRRGRLYRKLKGQMAVPILEDGTECTKAVCFRWWMEVEPA